MAQSRIIAFAGPVGSGKSTQMKLLSLVATTRTLKTRITFLKTGHLFAYILEVVLARTLIGERNDAHPTRVLIEDRPALFKKVFKLWLFLDIISIYLKFLLTIYLPLKMNYIVIVEDYIPATIADYMYLSGAVGLSKTRAVSFAMNFLPRLIHFGGPTQIIFLDAPTNALKTRWQSRMTFNEGSDYILMQRTLLLSVCKKLSSNKLFYVDTNKNSSEKTHDLILDHLVKERVIPAHKLCD